MDKPGSGGNVVRYYCTAGNGMEAFLINEVKTKLAAEDVVVCSLNGPGEEVVSLEVWDLIDLMCLRKAAGQRGGIFTLYAVSSPSEMSPTVVTILDDEVCQIPGKVLFSSSAKINRVSNLKGAERLFLLLKQDSPVSLSAHTGTAKAASVLQSRLLGDKNQWTSVVMTWSRLQGELTGSKTTIKTLSPALGVTRKREDEKKGSDEQSGDGEKSLVEFRTSTGGERKEETDRERSGGQNGVPKMAQKRKRDDEEGKESKVAAWDTSINNTVEKGKACKDERTREEEAEGMLVEFIDCGKNGTGGADINRGRSVCDHTTSRLEHRGPSTSRKMDDMAKDFTEESQENVKITGETNKTLLRACEDKPELLSCIPVSFRVSCKCSGSLSRCLGAQEVSRVIGAGLSRLLGWKTDLKNPQLEINVHLSDDYCLLGIPLTRLPLANRSYIKITGLRSTIAWAMTSLADIQPGSRVVDPMCGVGTILIEAAQEHKDACFLGVDIDEAQLQKASENIAFAEVGNRINLLKASSLVLPVPSATVDAVICDLPFGRKFGSRIDMAANLPLILTEMERVLRPGGILVLLLSPQLSCLLKKLIIQYDTGPTPNPETKPQTGMQNWPSSSGSPSKKQTFPIHSGVKSSPSQETKPQHSLSSLKHQATFRVSLGAIDGLIHKYVKIDCSVFRDVMF